MNIQKHNRIAWDKAVERGSEWTLPVSPTAVNAARDGEWEIILTPDKAVPRDWFGELSGAEVLCLASGGGQQAPILAAAGANVTVFDNSPQQLARDQMVADRDELPIKTELGDMRDLSVFADATFDLIVHPCANLFVDDVRAVWNESYRVLRSGGALLSGFCNPIMYIFDQQLMDKTGELSVKYSIPYSDLKSIAPEQLQKYLDDEQALEFGHSLEDQIGGQLDAGFLLAGYYDDYWTDTPLAKHIPAFCATRAVKL